MDLQLQGKTALVTGGSEGIGKGIALALAKEGVDVAICSRRKDVLEATASEIGRATNRKIVAIPADLRKDADAKNFIEKAHDALGRVDIMINNAGSAAGGVIEHLTEDDWEKVKLSYEEADKLAPSSIPMGRIAEVDEVANLVVMLASPLMHMVNGTMIEIDGGQEKSLMDRARDRK
jgi:NAD(P)-dependent dehydrogenase (short-subunit alcohol dehydrogenase family)